MRRFALPAAIIAVAVGLLAVLAYGISTAGSNNSLDSAVARHAYPVAPDAGAALPMLGSTKTLSLSQLRGRVVMVNMFAGWCDGCQAEAGVIRQAQQMLAAHGGTVLGVTYQDNTPDTLAFDQHYGVDYPVVTDGTGSFARAYGVSGVPETFIIDRQGKVLALRRYQLTSRWVEQTLPKILDGAS
jgi:cytochrome c biogenesis protein CcmG, thiol:disulfide interchange protein DsbE